MLNRWKAALMPAGVIGVRILMGLLASAYVFGLTRPNVGPGWMPVFLVGVAASGLAAFLGPRHPLGGPLSIVVITVSLALGLFLFLAYSIAQHTA